MPDDLPRPATRDAPEAAPGPWAEIDAIGFGICRLDGEGRCTHANPAALSMLGYGPGEVLGRNMHELCHHSHPDGSPFPQSACPLTAARVAGRPVRLFNEMLWRKDGSAFAAEIAAWPLPGGAGSVVTFQDSARQGVARDRLALQVTVSRILAGTAEMGEALPRLLAAVGGGLGARAAFFWSLSHRDRRLTAAASWAEPGAGAEALAERTDGRMLGRGEGLPGRAWEEEELAEAALPDGEARGEAAAAAGLGWALAIPVRVGRRMLGAIELFRPEAMAIDDDLRDNAAALGQQIGQYLRRRRAEEALRHREEEFRSLAEGIPQLTWIAEPDGAIEWFNRRWYDYTGSAPEQVQGWGWREILHPDHRERAEETYRAAVAAGEVWEDTFPLRNRDGRYRWFLSRAVPVPDDEGRIGRWFGTNTDITGQRLAESRAVEAERRLRLALQVGRIGSWSWEPGSEAIEADEGLRAILGLPGEGGPLAAEAFFGRLHPDDAAALRGALEEARRSEGEFDLEFRILAGEGDLRWAMARGSVERRPFGRGLHALGVIWDVTERKRHEEELGAARDAAESANRAKSQFIANMSHELRTPLSAIIGYAELLEEELEELGKAGEAVREDLGRIGSSARHLLTLINGVLDLSKVEAGKMEVHLEDFEVAPLAREVCDTVGSLMARNGNRFEADLPDDLGGMHSDPVKLRQCLFNLLSNAAKFTEGGEVRLGAAREGERLTFEVSDTGIGMTPEQRSGLFQRFAQADASTTRRFGGTGLGLALTRAFAEMLGGGIGVESEEGRGTTFTLSLPADARALPREEPAAEPRGAEVLVIDDDPQMRDLLARFLERDGLPVVVAADGETGLRLAREGRPSAILLDVMMPRMDGWAVLGALKADPATAGIPVIMVSMIRETGLAGSLGAADYLVKPIDWRRLRAALDRHRRGPGAGRALVAEPDAGTRAELRALLSAEGWEVAEAADAAAARARLAEGLPDLLLLDMERPETEGVALLRGLRRRPGGRDLPVLALTGGGLAPEERERLRDDRVRRVVQVDGDGMDEILAELRRIAAERDAQGKGTRDG